MRINTKVNTFLNSVLNSYSQVFFSENKLFAVLLLIVSFFDFYAGLFGLTAVITANVAAFLSGFDRTTIKKGLYGFNALLTGLGTGIIFNPGTELAVTVIFAALLTLFVTLALQGVLTKYGLPYLSLPFLFGIWAVILATKDFTALGLSERGIYTYNELYSTGGINLVKIYEKINTLPVIESVRIYFLSLGAIFFQNNILSGIVIAAGLLYYSRIAFSLSLIGFWAAYLFYRFIGADFSSLAYTFIGFNYILTSIAVGGYFVIASGRSYFWTLLLLPLTVMITASLERVFAVWQLSVYSLPFNISVLLFVYSLKLRTGKNRKPEDNFVKQKNPEQSLYLYKTLSGEFDYFPVNLPVKGKWIISQGYDGKYTHKDKWKHAWDFIIIDEEGSRFGNKGDYLRDYYCWEKPVFAPADGVVSEIKDGIKDNIPGDINTRQNWGNSVVIKHGEYLYSQVSHLKEGSIKVKKGDFVKKGDILGTVGNSGHSPYPHLHFQIQTTPYIGSETTDYPLHNFLKERNGKTELVNFGKPEENDIVSPAVNDEILKNVLHFIPGKKMTVNVKGKENNEIWEIEKDIFNKTYICEKKTKSVVYFYENESGLYLTNFYGKKTSSLFLFFSALNNIKKSFYKDTETKSNLRPDLYFGKLLMFFQDFAAPFYVFLKAEFGLKYIEKDDEFMPDAIKIKSEIIKKVFGKERDKKIFDIEIKKSGDIKIKSDSDYIEILPFKKKLNLN